MSQDTGFGRCLSGPRSRRSGQARILGLAAVGASIAIAGCTKPVEPEPPEYGILRMKLFQQCMAAATSVTPRSIADRGSWSEIVSNCGQQSYYIANTCDNERACLDALTASVDGRPKDGDAKQAPLATSAVVSATDETPETSSQGSHS